MMKSALVFLLLLAAAPTLADDNPACTCRAPGRRVQLGDTICLITPKGPKRAMCVMLQNVTSWSISDEGCEDAALSRPPVQPRLSRRPISSLNS